jgi:membrane associated rhomboid family serine protease
MMRITEVVKHLLIINVIMFFATILIMGEPSYSTSHIDWGRLWLGLFYPTSEFFQPFQIVTHMFMHADISHLFFNMFGLFMFGPPLEASWGSKRFLYYYFFTGFGAMILYMFVKFLEINVFGAPINIDIPMVGASGAIFGLLAGFGTMFPNQRIMLLIPPIPMKAKYFVLIYAGIELFAGVSGFQSGVAHFAHVGGALFGFLLIKYWQKYGSRL